MPFLHDLNILKSLENGGGGWTFHGESDNFGRADGLKIGLEQAWPLAFA